MLKIDYFIAEIAPGMLESRAEATINGQRTTIRHALPAPLMESLGEQAAKDKVHNEIIDLIKQAKKRTKK